MFYALGASVCAVTVYALVKCFCWQYRGQALILLLAITCVILFGLYNLPDNSSLSNTLFR